MANSNYYVDTGTVNALVVVGAQITAYTDGLLLEVSVASTTTIFNPTLRVNALGAKTIVDNLGC